MHVSTATSWYPADFRRLTAYGSTWLGAVNVRPAKRSWWNQTYSCQPSRGSVLNAAKGSSGRSGHTFLCWRRPKLRLHRPSHLSRGTSLDGGKRMSQEEDQPTFVSAVVERCEHLGGKSAPAQSRDCTKAHQVIVLAIWGTEDCEVRSASAVDRRSALQSGLTPRILMNASSTLQSSSWIWSQDKEFRCACDQVCEPSVWPLIVHEWLQAWQQITYAAKSAFI